MARTRIVGYFDENGLLAQREEIIPEEATDLTELKAKISKATTVAQIKAPLLEVLEKLEQKGGEQ